jgi:energy-coupling factor transporter ATP-binding protein EcfA2
VVALDAGQIVFDGPPDAFAGWAVRESPALATPGAILLGRAGLAPVVGVKRARAALRGIAGPVSGDGPGLWDRDRRSAPLALRFRGVWHELKDGPQILRKVDLEVRGGERVALMGANGAGKSTLLKHAAGLMKPTRGSIDAAHGRVALLLQNPNDYLVHETVADEASPRALARFDLAHLAHRHPRDLSGGERQRLALAIVTGEATPAVLCLDEPTRGMDRRHRQQLVDYLEPLGCAVLVATHDPEFAAHFADRVLLLAEGRLIADGSPQEILAGGTYFATEVARITDGARLLP